MDICGELVRIAKALEACENVKIASESKEIDQTFEVVTPKSAEDGDFADTGFTGQGWSFDFAEEAYKFLNGEGVVWVNGAGEAGGWWESASPDVDYRTGAETTYGYHPKGFTKEEIDYINRRLKGGEKEKEFDDPFWYDE